MSAPYGNTNAKGKHKTYNEVHRDQGPKSTHLQTSAREKLRDPKYLALLKKKKVKRDAN